MRRAAARAGVGCVALSTMRIVVRDDAQTRRRCAPRWPRRAWCSPARTPCVRRRRWRRCGASARNGVRDRRGHGRGLASRGHRRCARSAARRQRRRCLRWTRCRTSPARAWAWSPRRADAIASHRALRARGATVVRADVYARVSRSHRRRAPSRRCAPRAAGGIALSSGEALAHARRARARRPRRAAPALGRRSPAANASRGKRARWVSAHVRVAAGARPADLVAAHAARRV